MKFLVDVQLLGTLARWLNGRNLDAAHALELELGQANDRQLWDLAKAENRIVISKDEDFFILATRPNETGRLPWLRLGNCRIQDLLSRLNKDWEAIESAFDEGQRIVEIR